MKNLMDFCIGTPAFWLVGFGLMFGSGSAIIGTFDPLIRWRLQSHFAGGGSVMGICNLPDCFCATSATIVSGATAEQQQNSVHTAFIQQRFLF